ncbi:MAG TPA: transcription-repair coupling factor [Peptococcaceae bacterium]|nr:MAG: Transcription-repair coupling factor [Clostridia bacterium 41_269]HBT20684.1 transcription-repair coupling factor [Peptococcaceae bacterium]
MKGLRHLGLIKMLEKSEQYQQLCRDLELGKDAAVYGLERAQKHLFMGLCGGFLDKAVVIITTSEDRAQEIKNDISLLLSPKRAAVFPAREVLPVEMYALSREIISQRIAVLKGVMEGRIQFIVTTYEALSRRLPSPFLLMEAFIRLKKGDVWDRDELLKRLVAVGYERVDVVEIPGQFAARGGLLDIFPVTENSPCRIDFFDDEIETIRSFDAESQLSREYLSEITIPPAVEFPFSENLDLLEKGIEKIKKDWDSTKEILIKKGKRSALNKLNRTVGEFLEKIGEGFLGESLERYMPYLTDRPYTLLDYFKDEPVVFIDEPLQIEKEAEVREKDLLMSFENLLLEGAVLSRQRELILGFSEIKKFIKNNRKVYFSLLPKRSSLFEVSSSVSFHGRTLPEFQSRAKLLVKQLAEWKSSGYAQVIMTSSKDRGIRIKESLWENGIEAVLVPSLAAAVYPGQVVITYGTLSAGFELPQEKIAVITDREIFGRPKRRRIKQQLGDGVRISDITDIKPGDYVVHVHHGIGKYLGIVNLEVQGVKRDYLHLQYAGQDRLYVPTDQVELIQKYIGSEGHTPKLHKLGSSEWARAKEKVRKSVQELAKELLNLYAERQIIKGHAFSPNGPWQAEFEAAFPYKETPDQLKAILEVKADMEKPKPMDRLLVGDVGYGKTEVAMRAAFKAVTDGKQVAVLVPTTVLAHQHYRTFKERFSQFPVNIEFLSRLKKPSEQKKVVENLKKGIIDIIIGTHRLLSKDVQFKDLGLLIIDEEQRFGVAHKEKLKNLRREVDVLTLTATPIPRTLHMALAGARDMSVINTPPENRYPVQTYVVEYSRELVKDVIRRELSRGGQVFYVHNKVADLETRAHELESLVPEARVGVAHGQMPERQLEKIMVDFIQGDIDILVCTTIVENGLDIPNVNTLIVEEADNFGLAQLYQLRGRVGRSDRVAYAYFTYKRDKVLSEIAEKRLNAISEFTEFGSGFKLAMRDLEIRGAGNLLGPEQHGHMLAVGFDLYCQLLEEEVARLKGRVKEKEKEKEEKVEIEVSISAYIDDGYIREPSLKFEVYHRLREIDSEEEIEDLRKELEDRFGKLPKEVENLLEITRLRVLAQSMGAKSVKETADELKIKFRKEASHFRGDVLMLLAKDYPRRLKFSSIGGLEIGLRKQGLSEAQVLLTAQEILRKLGELSLKARSQGEL